MAMKWLLLGLLTVRRQTIYVISSQPPTSTQPVIPPGQVNWVLAHLV